MPGAAVPSPPHKDEKQARIGLIIPSSNRVVERELISAFPAAIGAHVTRVRVRGRTTTELLPDIGRAAELLADAFCNIIVFHCTASCMEQGVQVNARIIDTIEKASGRTGGTTASAIIHAVEALRLKKIVLLTPYSPQVNALQCGFFREIGVEVVASHAKHVNTTPDYCYIPSSYWHSELLKVAQSGTDGYLLSCANVPCLELIDRAESALKIPLLTSNQAVLWDSVRQAGIKDPIIGIGQLGTRPIVVSAISLLPQH